MPKRNDQVQLLGSLTAAQLAEAVEEYLKRRQPRLEEHLQSHGVTVEDGRIYWNLYGKEMPTFRQPPSEISA